MAYGTNAPFGLRPVASLLGGSWTEKTNEYYIYASDDGATTYETSIFTGDPVVFNGAENQHGTIARYDPGYADNTPSTFSEKAILGVFQGCEYVNTTGKLIKSPYWPASATVQAKSKIKAFVIDDPDVIWEIQVSTNKDAITNAFVAKPIIPVDNTTEANKGNFGSNFALAVGGGINFSTITKNGEAETNDNPLLGYANNPASGNTRTGQSAFYLCAATSTALNNNHDYDKTVSTLPLKAIGYSLNVKNQIYDSGGNVKPFLNVRVIINNHVFKAGTSGVTLS